MNKKIPCQYCRQRRRKCERLSQNEACQRCLQTNRKCTTQYIYVQDELLAEDKEERENSLELYQQVRHLEKQIQSLETSLHQEKALIQEPKWDLQIVNGELRLATEIKSLEELMMYGKSAIRYLSPFGDTFRAKTIVLHQHMHTSLVKNAMQIIARSFQHSDDPESTSSPKAISKRFSTGVTAFLEPQFFIERLIANFFSCFNDIVSILHEPSFMEHFHTLQDPMQDPLVLAICTCSAISTCKHNFFNSHEKRYFSEYFYDLTMEKLVDMFDDPGKALESVLVIHLLIPFMVTTSRVADSFKWSSMAMLLCDGLQKEYPDFAKGGPHLPRMTRIKYSIIHRNSVLPFRDFITCDERTLIKQQNIPIDILPDEPEKTRNIFKVFNLILSLSTHPAFVAVVTQARQVSTSDNSAVIEMNLEDIIRYEDTIRAWWCHLPQDVKICNNPFTLTKDMVEREINACKITMASYVHVTTIKIQACLIQPKSRKARALGDMDNIVSDKAIQLVLHSIDMCFHLMNQLEKIDSFCYSSTKILVRCIDTLMILLQVEDEKITAMAQSRLNDHMHALTRRVSPDHRVTTSASPFSMLTVAPPGPTPSVTELYKNYPLPREALIFDIVRTIVEQNARNIEALNTLS
ncbi:uncharacterized protein ATC70_010151 [Mucor velutinosus]|uniref:Zn(2)-C6 fungal-type domain-containing protein n=1 Tax=Mucor velutinosus TaxID=708070 RepID=A0AAN7I3T6_9FUNG|nr:hypothetical protein ATC70_010151 [Mucor velutinosus]